MRLIDADNLIKDVHEEWDDVQIWDETGDATACEIERLIDAQPTIDQWHYPSKGEYPDENGEYLFLVKAFSNIHHVVGDYEVLKNQRLWYAEIADHCIEDEPIAWMPLPELPKEEA